MKRIEPPYRVDDSGCWLAVGSLTKAGYGRTTVDGTRVFLHRHMWEQTNGPIPSGLEIDHLCRVRACCNPDHLEPVTHAENIRRGNWVTNSIQARLAKDHCPHGHPWDEENTRLTARQRKCRACEREQQRARRAAKRSAA